MDGYSELFVGLDTSRAKISVAVAEKERNGEVRFFGDISAEPTSVAAMVAKLAKRGVKLDFCYEAGPTGYDLFCQIVALGHEDKVVAPSLIPKRPGNRVQTNRRDAVSLARLHRAGELTAVCVPDRLTPIPEILYLNTRRFLRQSHGAQPATRLRPRSTFWLSLLRIWTSQGISSPGAKCTPSRLAEVWKASPSSKRALGRRTC
jgi:hypothetical protein